MKQGAEILVYEEETEGYKRINDKMELYTCKENMCMALVEL